MKHNDEPTLHDLIERQRLVKEVGDQVADCTPPQVFGIHGDWGCGKTSFLHQLHWYLAGECPESQDWQKDAKPTEVEAWQPWQAKPGVTVVWFEAWRYQNEPNPIVALLQEIRTQLQWSKKFWNYVKKETEVAAYGALFGLENLTKYLQVDPAKVQEAGEKWEREDYAVKLPTHVIRAMLEQVVSQLLGVRGKAKSDARLVVLIDDLDRCESETAYRLLEGIKIYLNVPNCLFVLGMDQKVIQLGVEQHLPAGNEADRAVLAAEYIDKICRRIWNLPQLPDCPGLLAQFLDGVPGNKAICDIVRAYHCLPANPRKIKAFADVVERFARHVVPDPAVPPDMGPLSDLRDVTLPRGHEGRALDARAGLIVLFSVLYQSHYPLYRAIEGDPRFYHTVRDWAQGIGKHELLKGIRLPQALVAGDEREMPGVPEFRTTFADPMRGNVFRVQDLIIDLGEVAENSILACILGRT